MSDVQDFFLSSEMQQHVKLLLLASVISYGATEVAKPFLKDLFKDRDKSRAMVRLLAVVVGAAVARTLGDTWDDIWYGAGAGVLNAWAIAIIKKKLEDRFQVKLRHEGGRSFPLLETPPPQAKKDDKDA